MMKCGDNKQRSKSKVLRKNTKQERGKHRPLQKFEVGSGEIIHVLFSVQYKCYSYMLYSKPIYTFKYIRRACKASKFQRKKSMYSNINNHRSITDQGIYWLIIMIINSFIMIFFDES